MDNVAGVSGQIKGLVFICGMQNILLRVLYRRWLR
jgi:hypothetical protein